MLPDPIGRQHGLRLYDDGQPRDVRLAQRLDGYISEHLQAHPVGHELLFAPNAYGLIRDVDVHVRYALLRVILLCVSVMVLITTSSAIESAGRSSPT